MPGRAEPLKAGVHGALLGLAVVCTGYNLIAFCLRKDAHLARNTLIYGSLAALETIQVRKHLGEPR